MLVDDNLHIDLDHMPIIGNLLKKPCMILRNLHFTTVLSHFDVKLTSNFEAKDT